MNPVSIEYIFIFLRLHRLILNFFPLIKNGNAILFAIQLQYPHSSQAGKPTPKGTVPQKHNIDENHLVETQKQNNFFYVSVRASSNTLRIIFTNSALKIGLYANALIPIFGAVISEIFLL